MEGKTAQISQNTLIKNFSQGGLKLCHYPTKVKALQLSWIKRICNESGANWKSLPEHFYNCNDHNLYVSANHTHLKCIKEILSFYKDIHDLYMNNFKKEPTPAQDILEQSIWLNEQITVNNNCIHCKSWKNAGILYINDIINPSNGHFLSHEIFLPKKINIRIQYMETLQIQSSISKSWTKTLKQNPYSSPISNIQYSILINRSKLEIVEFKCKDYYWHFINNIMHTPKAITEWENIYTNFKSKDSSFWKTIFKMHFICSRHTSIQ